MKEPRVVESIANECQSLGRAHESSSARAEQLIACLEGEIAKRDEELAACHAAVENCDLFRARIAELDDLVLSLQCKVIERDAELAAIKAQESVANDESGLEAWAAGKFGAGGAFRGELCGNTDWALARLVWSAALAYAAPVSEAKAQGVVMPPSPYMPGSQPTDFTDYELWEIHGRIAMWEEVKRLNAAHVQQVSVPDGWEASLNLALVLETERAIKQRDEFLKTGISTAALGGSHDTCFAAIVRRHIAMLAASPAAPAADAGIVDMYRNLQKVTPYRFKKIQDAAVTDGGDVLYFHKDRFDAALLDDMAAHRAQGVV